MWKRLAVVMAVIALTGCAAETAAPEEPKESAESTIDAMAFCETFGGGLTGYTDFVSSTASGNVDVAEWKRQMAHVEELESLVPDDGRASLAKFADPAYQIKKVVGAGGGNLSFSTDDFKAGVTDTLEYCVDAGYTKS